jgi:L-threonylcarbamoyladenylate synthase
VEVVDRSEVTERARVLAEGGRRVGLLAMKPSAADPVPASLAVLGEPADVAEYARVLYARLREADERALDVLLVVLPGRPGNGDTDGLEAAIADRVRRASQ